MLLGVRQRTVMSIDVVDKADELSLNERRKREPGFMVELGSKVETILHPFSLEPIFNILIFVQT